MATRTLETAVIETLQGKDGLLEPSTGRGATEAKGVGEKNWPLALGCWPRRRMWALSTQPRREKRFKGHRVIFFFKMGMYFVLSRHCRSMRTGRKWTEFLHMENGWLGICRRPSSAWLEKNILTTTACAVGCREPIGWSHRDGVLHLGPNPSCTGWEDLCFMTCEPHPWLHHSSHHTHHFLCTRCVVIECFAGLSHLTSPWLWEEGKYYHIQYFHFIDNEIIDKVLFYFLICPFPHPCGFQSRPLDLKHGDSWTPASSGKISLHGENVFNGAVCPGGKMKGYFVQKLVTDIYTLERPWWVKFSLWPGEVLCKQQAYRGHEDIANPN